MVHGQQKGLARFCFRVLMGGMTVGQRHALNSPCGKSGATLLRGASGQKTSHHQLERGTHTGDASPGPVGFLVMWRVLQFAERQARIFLQSPTGTGRKDDSRRLQRSRGSRELDTRPHQKNRLWKIQWVMVGDGALLKFYRRKWTTKSTWEIFVQANLHDPWGSLWVLPKEDLSSTVRDTRSLTVKAARQTYRLCHLVVSIQAHPLVNKKLTCKFPKTISSKISCWLGVAARCGKENGFCKALLNYRSLLTARGLVL